MASMFLSRPGGPLKDGFDQDTLARTVKIQVGGKNAGTLYRSELARSLCVDVRDIESMWKGEQANVWQVTLKNAQATKALVGLRQAVTNGGRSLLINHITSQEIILKIHWLPSFVRDSWVAKQFADYGTVLDVVREQVEVDGAMVENGVRRVYIQLSEIARNRVPHVIRYEDGSAMLITCPGRLPLCLACRCLGHTRPSCPNKNGPPTKPGKGSYSDSVKGVNPVEPPVPQPQQTKQHQPDEGGGENVNVEEIGDTDNDLIDLNEGGQEKSVVSDTPVSDDGSFHFYTVPGAETHDSLNETVNDSELMDQSAPLFDSVPGVVAPSVATPDESGAKRKASENAGATSSNKKKKDKKRKGHPSHPPPPAPQTPATPGLSYAPGSINFIPPSVELKNGYAPLDDDGDGFDIDAV